MILTIILIFLVGYACITLEAPLGINKSAIAIVTGVLCWTVYALFSPDQTVVASELKHHVGGIVEILLFLLSAMTIVELIDAHKGFNAITNRITSTNRRKLLWIFAILTFFISACLDNLATAIVMITLLRKLIKHADERKYYAGIIIIAANAGGAWSPIGDVTTTLLWLGGRVSTLGIMQSAFIPSLLCMLIPTLVLSFKFKGETERIKTDMKPYLEDEKVNGSKRMLLLGVGALMFAPIYKTLTNLPPYMGTMFGLAVVWITSELLHVDKSEQERKPFSAVAALSKIDSASVLFFFGILSAVACLESTHILGNLADLMDANVGDKRYIVIAIGFVSAVIDNGALVAATMGMYPLTDFPMDNTLWNLVAFCAGTGGSMLIIGSAAGVAVMSMEKIDFVWYFKHISVLAFLGYASGVVYFLVTGSRI